MNGENEFETPVTEGRERQGWSSQGTSSLVSFFFTTGRTLTYIGVSERLSPTECTTCRYNQYKLGLTTYLNLRCILALEDRQ